MKSAALTAAPTIAVSPHKSTERRPGELPQRPGFLFRTRLTVVALGIALLGAIYLAALAGLGIAALWILNEGEAFDAAIGNAPLAWAVRTLLFFSVVVGFLLMSKGLLRIEPRRERAFPVDRRRESDLYALAEYLAEALHTPVPVRIESDCGAEIRVDHAPGLSGLTGKQLVVRVGLSAAAALNSREFAATLAAALARYAHGTGARRAYFVRSANRFLAQCTGGEDGVDRWLAHQLDNRLLAPFARMLQAFSQHARREGRWLQQRVARLSEGVLRQHQLFAQDCAAFVGGRASARRLPARHAALRTAAVNAATAARQMWDAEGRLPESLPTETVRHMPRAEPMPADEVALINCATPATSLFSHFPRMARRASLLCYRLQFGLPASGDRLGPAMSVSGKRTAIDNFFFGCFAPLVPLGLAECKPISPLAARAAVRKHLTAVVESYKRYQQADRELVATLQAETLMSAGIALLPSRLGVEASTLESVHERCRDLEGRVEWLASRVGVMQRLVAGRLRQAVEQEGPGGTVRPEDHRMLEMLTRTDRIIPQAAELRTHLLMLEVLLAERIERDRPALNDRIVERSDDVLRLLQGLRVALKNTPYPIGSGEQRTGLHRYVIRRRPESDLTALERLELGQEALERLLSVRRAAIGRLVVLAANREAQNR